MSFPHIVWNLKSEISAAAHAAIIMGLVDTWSRCRHRGLVTPHEPDFVAGLVLEASPLMWKAFREILRPFRVSISLFAVYCHQTPKVRYAEIAKTSTEVGDILFAHIHRDRSGKFTRNALLYQAKVSSKQPYRVPPSEEHQLRLYTEWPEFEYYRSPPLSGQRRSVLPHSPHSGAQYLLIDNRHPADPRSGFQLLQGTYPIGSCLADEFLHDHNHLAGELVDFFRARSGRRFEGGVNEPLVDGWSELVWDLIKTSARKAFNRKHSGRRDVPRITGMKPSLLDGDSVTRGSSGEMPSTIGEILGVDGVQRVSGLERDSPPGRGRARSDNLEPESGISLVLFETSEVEGEEPR